MGMLDNLLDIEVAYSLLKSGEGDLAKDPLDVNYAKLQTDLEVSQILSLQSAMFKGPGKRGHIVRTHCCH